MKESENSKSPMVLAIDTAINLAVIFLVLAYCLQVLAPLLSLLAWGGIIAIALYPLYRKLEGLLGGRRKLALTLVVLIGGAVIMVPLWMFTTSVLETSIELRGRIDEGTLTVAPPNESVRDWPVIGERVYSVWGDASANLSAFMAEHQEQIRTIARSTLSRIAGAGLGALQFFVSIVIAAAFLANTEGVSRVMSRLLTRIAGQHGESLKTLSVATIRSIAVGVLGIAVIQAFASGLGIALVGLPAAGLWALIVLLLAVVQLPPLLILLPLAVYVFSIESTTVAVIFAVWCFIVSASDAVLKPLLLGRGVDAPMLVILLGAIGGMILSGIIGLFVGAVALGLTYKLFQIWLAADEAPASKLEEASASTD